ncbi:type I secretion system permease/ATPase [Bradyrhizobium sp.]|uniref:type I secretion system permease/ATPase n=1 Tax=Bradyrhizobium sp. TaxID=376 RepID=UPI0028FF6686|nr:type I secretion system permease/ATPase [Bradyrhizobium sp.]MDU3039617.1 type I secretion system permease/ATPase [Bradyrhizobium sp.]
MTTTTARSPLGTALRACFPALTATFVLSLFINASMLASPLYSMQVYDRVLTSRNLGTLVMLTLIVGVFLVLYGILEFARSGVLARAGVQFEGTLRHPLFETMMKAELSPRHRFGQQIIRDAETIRDCISSGTAAIACDLPWTPVFVALCFLQHAYLGILSLLGAVVLFSLALLTEFCTRSSVERTNALANEASRFVAAALRNGEVVRGLGMGDIVMDRWSCRQSAMVDAHSTLVERGAAMHSITKFARMAVQTSLLCIGAWLAIEQQISPGAMMATSIIMGRALAPVEQVVGQWKRIIAFRSAYRRLEELFQALPVTAAPTALPAPRGDIDVENAVVWPPAAGRPSVKGVSFSLKAGESLAIVGASASGKSSMARAMAGVWPLREGVIRIDGAAYSQWDQNRLGKHIGYLPQDIELFSGTVADNIARLAKVDEAAVVAAAKAAGAHEVILRLPNGYDTPIGEGGVALSGGMRQRVGLARALYGDPRLLILDEPNSNLDEDGERALAHAMAQAKAAGRTVIVVTHRPQLLAHVDRIMVMSFGKSLAFGERDEVIARMRGQRVVVAHDRAAATAA